MKPIEIPIYIHTEETSNLDNLGIDYEIDSNCGVANGIFYSISCIYPRKEGGTYILTNGSEFITPYSYEFLKEKIESLNF